ncbi:hypothetical protein B1H10_06795 [candidate division KSB1 bacterium 4484_188]|nr:MAG: hypothetical protein B1H10_06795 [candidate division KSB1 bacterium 4484_188]
MALLFGEDKDDLVLTKKTIQQIYNADYRFAKPPDKPRLKAVIPGNNRVILVWDSRAEKSWDPFLQEYDFEGYRIYRSTEPEFLENRLITDAYGRLTFRKPIAQFDLKNQWSGLHPIDVSGAHFDLGDNSGLQHYYIDNDVKNGQTYYYAIVSYDHGLVDTSVTGGLVGLSPAECTSKIAQDLSGNVTVDINTAVVVPRAPAAGYVDAGLAENVNRQTIGTGDVKIRFLVPDSVLDGHTYSIEFGDTAYFHNLGNPFYVIYDITNGQKIPRTDTLWIDEDSQSPLIDGFVVNIHNDQTDLNRDSTGWILGSTNYRWRVNQDSRFSNTNPMLNFNINYPADFLITFSDQIVDTAENVLLPPDVPTKFTRFYLEADSADDNLIPPAPGDIFRISTKKGFRTGDRIEFKVSGESYDVQKAKQEMDKIAVVPNPYVVAASWEPRSPYRFGRGERKIYFIHLPKKCTIRIYSLRGYLVDTIEHNGTIDDGQEAWDVLNKDGQEIAYGVYVFHVDAPGVGEKIGKFAIIK